jgi:hypothetical protein
VFEGSFGIDNPFFPKTKTQILKDTKDAGYSSLCAGTVSCVHTREMTNEQPHCGRCSQCLDRRLVCLAAGFDAKEDPPQGYRFNVFEDPLESIDRVLFEGYAEVINRIQRIDNAVAFCAAYPEVTRAINFIDGRADDVAESIFRLYKRHVDEVGAALDAQGQQAFPRIRRRELHADSFLSILAAGLRRVSTPVTAQVFPTATTPNGQDGALVIDGARFQITWLGRGPHDVGNRKEFHLLSELWSSRDKYVPHADLAERLGGDDNDKITHVKSRLVKRLKECGLEDLAALIKTQKGHYGLIIS